MRTYMPNEGRWVTVAIKLENYKQAKKLQSKTKKIDDKIQKDLKV